jgi:electron transfer flavoprotein alpha subunit
MILVLIEHKAGTIENSSLELLAMGRELAQELGTGMDAVMLGEDAAGAVQGLAGQDLSKVHLIEHERLHAYAAAAWAESVLQLLGELEPDALIAAGSERGNELMAHIAARAGLPMAANCTAVSTGEEYRVTRLRWGGSLLEEADLSGVPKLLTVAPGAYPGDEGAPGSDPEIGRFTPTLGDAEFRARVTETTGAADSGISLADARVVVGGGRGVGSEEGFGILQELADLLNGAVGSSRAATNLGWRAHADQIGQTGTRIAPELYIACGISGAIQHMVGCKGSKKMLAINTDGDAPILAKADYAVIGDLHQVIPALIAEIERGK